MGTSPCFSAFDLAGVDIHADDVVAHLGEAGPRDETHIAGSKDRDFHEAPGAFDRLVVTGNCSPARAANKPR